MTLETLPLPRRRTVGPLAAVLFVISVGLFILSAWLWASGDNKVVVIDLVDATPVTTLVPVESVGLIAPACATVDPVAYPCAPQMIGVQS